MYIDLSKTPPSDLFRHRRKYLRLASLFLLLAVSGILLALYTVVSVAPYSQTLEDIALGLIVGPGLIFVYFAEKFMDYRRLSQEQERELALLVLKHPEVAAYCAQVAKADRRVVVAEFEACQALAEKSGDKR